MPSVGSVFTSAINDVGNTYQQVLLNGTGIYQRQDLNREIAEVNPEYVQMQGAYAAQEMEREAWEGITEASYEPTDIDWQEYGQYLDETKSVDYELQQEPDFEPER